MEEYNDLEQVTGSPSSGEGGFVHVEPIDSASIDGSSINQDDGVVVTSIDTAQYESSDLRMTEDGGTEEFVDCPDDLVSYDGLNSVAESSEGEVAAELQQTFGKGTEDIQHGLVDSEREILLHEYQVERQQLMTGLTNLHHQLKDLIKKNSLIGGDEDEFSTDQSTSATLATDEKSLLPLNEIINDCSKFIDLALSKQSQTESAIRELQTTLDSKDTEIENLVTQISSIETISDQILSSLATVVIDEEFPDTSVNGKLSRVEKSTSVLIMNHNYFLSEAQMLNQCLAEDHMQTDMNKVFFFVREELLELKRKEYELAYRNSHLEYEYGKLMEQLNTERETVQMLHSNIEKLKGEVEVENRRYNNTKEKLGLAVTKGKSLVQQRDSLKQVIMEKTDELDKCLLELQEKSKLEDSLKESLSQKDTILEKCEQVLSLSLGGATEKLQSLDIVDKITWLSDERSRLEQKLTELLEKFMDLLYEKDQECKMYEQILEEENMDKLEMDICLNKLAKVSEELCALKDKNGSLQIDLQRSEEKSGLLREKLSMAVKRGKSLVQERESMKLQMAEMNDRIEGLNLEIKQQEATINDMKSLEDKLSILEINVSRLTEENKELEMLKTRAEDELHKSEQEVGDLQVEVAKLNNKLVEVLKNLKELEDVQSNSEKTISHLTEEKKVLEVSKSFLEEKLRESEQEVGDLQEEVAKLNNKLVEVLKALKELEDVKSNSEKTITYLTEEKKVLEASKTYVEDELHKSEQEVGDLQVEVAKLNNKLVEVLKNLKTLEDVQSDSEKTITHLTEEKKVLEASKTYVEDELHKTEQEMGDLQEEVAKLNNKLGEALKNLETLEDVKSNSEKTITRLTEEKKDLEVSKSYVEENLHKALEEATSRNSLQEELSLAEKNISVLMTEKEDAQNNVKTLENEIKKFKEKASETIKSLEDELLKTKNHISDVVEQKNADNYGFDPQSFLDNLQVLLKDETLLTFVKQGFEKKFEIFKDMDRNVNDVMGYFDSAKLQDYPSIEESFQVSSLLPASFENVLNTEMTNTDDISSYAGKTLESLTLKNQIFTNEFTRFSKFIDEVAASLLIKLDAMRNIVPVMIEHTKTLQENVNNLQIDKQAQENRVVDLENEIKVLLSACVDVTKEMKFLVENNILEIESSTELEKFSFNPSSDVGAVDDKALADVKVVEEMLSASRNVQNFIGHFVDVKRNMSTTITKLQAKLENATSAYDRAKEENDEMRVKLEELKGDLENATSAYDKEKEGNEEKRVKLEDLLAKLENATSVYDKAKEESHEMRGKLEELQTGLENATSAYDKAKEENNEMRFKLEELQAESENATSAFDKAKEENNEMRFKLEELQAELKNTTSAYGKAKEENNEIRVKLDELQAESENATSAYDKAKEENNEMRVILEDLQAELENATSAYEKAKEEKDEMRVKLEDNQAKEEELNKREAELSKQTTAVIKDHEAENDLLSPSDIKSLFNKINGIIIPFPNIETGETEPHDLNLNPTKKLFYIVDSVDELLDQITLLSHSKEDLQSTLSKQALEIEQLNQEFNESIKDKKELLELITGFERIISNFGGDEFIGGKKSADVAALERLIQGIVLDSENSKAKAQELGIELVETKKVVEELGRKVKEFEDFNKNRLNSSEIIQERGISEVSSSSLPPRTEITEVQDVGPIGKRSVPSAAQVRTLRKGSNDHLSINIDSESDHLIDKQETDEDKRHIFKSLHTTGLVPTKGKIIADRLDGIWVSGDRALMSRPRARLGLIAYWLVLHLWLLGTLL